LSRGVVISAEVKQALEIIEVVVQFLNQLIIQVLDFFANFFIGLRFLHNLFKNFFPRFFLGLFATTKI
jgi:hypothetical protein